MYELKYLSIRSTFDETKMKWVWCVFNLQTNETLAQGTGIDSEHSFQCALNARNSLVNGKLPEW